MKRLGVLIVVSLTCLVFVNGQNSSNSQPVSTAGNSELGEESALEKGAKPLYNLVHGFLDSVQRDNFIAANSDSKITYKDIEGYITNGTLSELADRWQDMVSVFGGYAACIVVGLLFAIFMPIIGLFFCCCYCCCKRCGKAREESDPKSAGCKRATFCFFLAIFATMMLTGAIVSIIANELLHIKLQNSDKRGPVQYMNSGLGDLVSYADKTTADLDKETKEIVSNTIYNIKQQINGSVSTTVESVKSSINASALLTQTENLGNKANQTYGDLVDITTNLYNLTTLQNKLASKITEINKNFTDTCNSSNPPVSPCPKIPDLSKDFTGLRNLTTEIDKVKDALDISSLTEQAKKEFDKVVNDIYPSLKKEIDDAMKKADDIKDNLNNEISKLTDTTRQFADGLRNDSSKEINNIDKYLKDYADYIWYGGIGLPCIIILTSVLYYLGILFGLCGERPGRGAPCCNRGTGSSFLVSGVVWTYLLFWLVMYIVLIFFLVGGLLYTSVCRNLNQGVENIGDYEPILKEYDIDIKNLLNYSDNSNFSVKQALIDCRNNMGIYSALQLQNKFNIDEVLDTEAVLKEVRNLTSSSNFNINPIVILSPSLNESLTEFANSGITNINFTSYEEQLNKTPVANLSGIIQDLKDKGLTTQATIVTNLQNEEIKDFESKMNETKAGLNRLKTLTSLQGDVADLQVSLKETEDKFNNKSNQLIKEGLNNTVNNVTNIVLNGVEDAKSTTKNIGECSKVYTAAQKLSDAVCEVLLDPFNTFWFGLGWGIFFCIPSIIFALLLANMYQRERKFDEELHRAKKESRQKQQERQDFDSPMMETYHDDHIPLTSPPNGGYGQSNNGAVNQGYYNDRRDDYHRGNHYRDDYRHDDYRGSRGDPYYRQGERDYPPPSYHDSRNYPSPGHHEAYPVLPPTTKNRY